MDDSLLQSRWSLKAASVAGSIRCAGRFNVNDGRLLYRAGKEGKPFNFYDICGDVGY